MNNEGKGFFQCLKELFCLDKEEFIQQDFGERLAAFIIRVEIICIIAFLGSLTIGFVISFFPESLIWLALIVCLYYFPIVWAFVKRQIEHIKCTKK